ncbi:MAG: hypothetical protein HOV73_18495 [Streptomyces sp.]|nr:hypothetical protein [Streptomyces sp.]NUR42073.1 hypothetical protein [Streptomyces sp.]NUS15229.1 hypothetical protein [Streptomyces sp.]NUS25569.1 hypothetical protein [Streptomyces sp.]NUS76551.1 hypothetical protein [Streptomyces sp.]
MRTTATLATTAALLLALTACSSSDDSSDADTPASSPTATVEQPTTTPTPAESAELTAAVQRYTTAYFKGDGDTAYGALSKRCKGKIDAVAYGSLVDQAAADYGPDHSATDVEAEVSGKLARVTYKVSGLPKLDQDAQPWAREGGDWKYDAC